MNEGAAASIAILHSLPESAQAVIYFAAVIIVAVALGTAFARLL